MKPIHINFCAGSESSLKRRGFVIFAVGVCGLLAVLAKTHLVEREHLDLGNRILDVRKHLEVLPKSTSADASEANSRIRFRLAVKEIVIPWDSVFRAVEEAGTATIRLESMEPDGNTGVIRIVAQAPSYDDALTYVDRLSNRSIFQEVVLASHQLSDSRPGSPTQFVVTGKWTAR